MTTIKWCTAKHTEQWLKIMGIPFTTGSVPLSAVDMVASRRLQARRGKREKEEENEQIIGFKVAMESGVPFSMPILQKHKGGYRIWDGLNRVSSAALLGVEALDAYIVDEATLPPRFAHHWGIR
jgi:hypothetical protein